MRGIVGIRSGGRRVQVIQETREVDISTSMRLEDLVHRLQGPLEEAREQECIDPPNLDIEIRNSYGDLHLHSTVFWYRPATEEEIAEDTRLRAESRREMRESAKESIKKTVKRNPDIAREALAELEQDQ